MGRRQFLQAPPSKKAARVLRNDARFSQLGIVSSMRQMTFQQKITTCRRHVAASKAGGHLMIASTDETRIPTAFQLVNAVIVPILNHRDRGDSRIWFAGRASSAPAAIGTAERGHRLSPDIDQ
jgi:hypothetical protein